MGKNHRASPSTVLGRLLDKHLRERELSLEALAGSEFSVPYVEALIAGRVVPSHLTLHLLAGRLGIDEGDLREAAHHSVRESLAQLDLSAQEEDLTYAFDSIRHLSRSGLAKAALEDVEQLAEQAQPYMHLLPSRVAYQFLFLRARAYAQQAKWQVAEELLLEALPLVKSLPEDEAQVHNLLGAVYYGSQQQRLALREHLAALDYVLVNPYRNLNLSLGVYQNLANDYLALGYGYQTINAYRRALHLVEHLDADARRARLYWGLAEAYRKQGKFVQAVTCGLQASDIYKVIDSQGEATAVMLNLSEILLDNGRYSDAEDLLTQSGALLAAVPHPGLRAYLQLYKSRLARKQGQLERAAGEALEGIKLAETLLAETEQEPSNYSHNKPWISPARALIEITYEAALVKAALNYTEAACLHFERALDLARRIGAEDLYREIARTYALHLAATGNDKQAALYLRESVAQVQAETVPKRTPVS